MSLVQVEDARESAHAVADTGDSAPEREGAPPTREVRHEYTRSLPPLLSQLGVSLLVSTYQAGKVVAVGIAQGELTLSYHNFERAMGLAVKPDGIAVAARAQVWLMHAAPDLATRVEPTGRYDACFLTRSSHFTARSRPTSWRGRAMSCGSSTRPLAACARSTAGIASYPTGGRRSFRRWRPMTAVTSTAWPWPTASRDT
jgi:hypothetical protein